MDLLLSAAEGTAVQVQNPADWSPKEICDHLTTQSWSNEALVQAVEDHRLGGEAFLALNKADLVEFGIESPVERNRILLNISQLTAATVRNKQRIAQESYDDVVIGMEPPPVAFISSRNTPRKSKYQSQATKSVKQAAPAPPSPQSSIALSPKPPSEAKSPMSPPSPTSPSSTTSPISPSRRLGFSPTAFTPSAPPRKFGSPKRLQSPKALPDQPDRIKIREIEIDEAALNPAQRRLYHTFKFLDEGPKGWISERQMETVLRLLYPEMGVLAVQELHQAVMRECDKLKQHMVVLADLMPSEAAQRKGDIAQNLDLRQERRDVLTKLFKEADEKEQGFLEPDQLRGVVRMAFRFFSPIVQEDYCNAIVGKRDAINLQSLVTDPYAMMELRPQPMDETKVARLKRLDEGFDRVDVKKTGAIAREQFPEFARAVWPTIVPQEIERYEPCVFADCDPDRTGVLLKSSLPSSQFAELLANSGMRLFDGDEDSGKGMKKRNANQSPELALKLGPMMSLAEGKSSPQSLTSKTSNKSAPAHLKTVEAEREEMERMHAQQAQQVFSGAANRTAPAKQGQAGLLEMERRYANICAIFARWDESSSQHSDGSNAIEFDELKAVLAEFFNWNEDEADEKTREVRDALDVNRDGILQFEEFAPFINAVTNDLEPQMFDRLVTYLKYAISNVSDDSEFERRDMMLIDLFKFWDYDRSGYIEEDEVGVVMKRYLESPDDPRTDRIVELVMNAGHRTPLTPRSAKAMFQATPRLELDQFKQLFHGLTAKAPPRDFDLLFYRLKRVVDVTNKSSGKRALTNSWLVSNDMQHLLKESTHARALLMHGDSIDPSTSLEKLAQANSQRLVPCMVTNSRSQRECLAMIALEGFARGAWFYVVLAPEPYDPGEFLRDIMLQMQTKSGSIKKSFRLWVWAPYEKSKVLSFPKVMLTYSQTLDLNKVKIPRQRKGPAASVVAPVG